MPSSLSSPLRLTEKLESVRNLVRSKMDLIDSLKRSSFSNNKPTMAHRRTSSSSSSSRPGDPDDDDGIDTPSWYSASFDQAPVPAEETVVDGVLINKMFAASDIDALPLARAFAIAPIGRAVADDGRPRRAQVHCRLRFSARSS